MSEIVEKIEQSSIKVLSRLVVETLESVERQVVDQIGDFRALSQQSGDVLDRFASNMTSHYDELLDREVAREEAVFNFENLSLVQEEELEVIVALEGMVNAARNEHLPVFISFNTRLSSLFPRKRIDESSNPLDPEQVATAFSEALRPVGLDPQNTLSVYRAFNKCVLKHLDEVLKEANSILVESSVIPDMGMEGGRGQKPERARSGRRGADEISGFGTVEEEHFEDTEERPELFSIMQNLLHFEDTPATQTTADGGPAAGTGQAEPGPAATPGDGQPAQQYMIPASMIPSGMMPDDSDTGGTGGGTMQPFQPQDGQQVQMVDQVKLMEILTSIQETLKTSTHTTVPGSIEEAERLDISESLGAILKASSGDNVVSAVDRQSSDIINLVTLLYEAIWQDPSVPIPIKELIGRTQITIIKVALADVEFFNNENHPARAILNEFAAAGIGWTEVEELEQDPLYRKIQELVERILVEYSNNNDLFDELIQDFRTFRAMEKAKVRHLEQSIMKAKERQGRLEDIHELITQKIAERVLGRELHPFVEELLNGPFHQFMVKLVLKEGPGGNAWKQSINTIDVLLWSVQAHDQEGDRDRLETVNPRLLNNLRKAFRIASIEKTEVDELIAQLQKVQYDSFSGAADQPDDDADAQPDDNEQEQEQAATGITFHAAEKRADKHAEPAAAEVEAGAAVEFTRSEPAAEAVPAPEKRKTAGDSDTLADDDPLLRQVDNLSVGIWVQFAGVDDSNTRCKLAAKINAIDKYIFVNRQGVKVVEKTRMGLARELRDGTVSIISDGLLFSRALESVIGNLRESQQEQQTGGAYQPSQSA